MLLTTISVLSLASAAAAQSVVTVQVGGTSSMSGGIFQYIPPTISASNGTVVNFQFLNAGNHSITQSSFSDPCSLMTDGFDSGWVLVTASEAETPQFNLTITDDSHPIWFYCKQLNPSPHCAAGMVGAINAPTSGNTFSSFQAAARAVTTTPVQSVGNLVGVGASASAPVSPIPTGVTNFGAPTPGAASGTATGTAATASSSAPSGSSSGATPTSTTSGASHVSASSLFVLLGAALAFAMA